MEERKKKERGIYLRKDGRWEARYSIGRAAQGKTKYESIYGWSKEEVAKKLSNMGLRYAYNREEPGRIKFSPFPPAETAESAIYAVSYELRSRGLAESTRTVYEGKLRRFLSDMNMGNPQKLTMLDAKQYIYRMRNEKNAAARTCNSFITAIKYLFIFGLQKEWDDKLFPHLRSKNKLPVVLSRQELDALFSSFKSPAYRMIAIVMYSSGLRVSEAVRLRVGDIHRDTMQISVTEGKGGKDRRAVLSEQCLRELEQYWRQYRPKDYFFPSKDYTCKYVSVRSFQMALDAAVKNAGIAKHVTSHTLRHSFATHLVATNTGLFQTMEALGHASLASTQRYVHLAGPRGVTSPYDRT